MRDVHSEFVVKGKADLPPRHAPTAPVEYVSSEFTAEHPKIVVNVRPFDTHAEAEAAVTKMRAAGKPADLFLAESGDIAQLRADKAIRRVDDLLGARQVDFGDGFTRGALVQYSDQHALQCMPIEYSPMVVYINSGLIDPDTIARPGERPVSPDNGWTMAQFARAAQVASRHGRRGLYVDPTLEQVAPFLLSGGTGTLADDQTAPTTLTLGDDANVKAMQQLLEVVRNPRLTFNQKQLSRKAALNRFRSGELGMMLGFRDLTPALREQEGLPFDVMPMPVLNRRATVGMSRAACVAAGDKNLAQVGDFLAFLVSDPSMRRLAQTGYVQPTNADVMNSSAFTQPSERPFSGRDVFTKQVRYVLPMPSSPDFNAVARRVQPDLRQLFFSAVIDPLQDRMDAMDTESQAILSPSDTASPTASPSASPTPTQ